MTKLAPTLYEWAALQKNFGALAKVFYDNVFQDDLLLPVFRNMSEDHFKPVAHFIAEVFGRA